MRERASATTSTESAKAFEKRRDLFGRLQLETMEQLHTIFESGTRTRKNAEYIGRRPNYLLTISPKWDKINPIGKIPGFSHNLTRG
jgi:hypothetical protein